MDVIDSKQEAKPTPSPAIKLASIVEMSPIINKNIDINVDAPPPKANLLGLGGKLGGGGLGGGMMGGLLANLAKKVKSPVEERIEWEAK